MSQAGNVEPTEELERSDPSSAGSAHARRSEPSLLCRVGPHLCAIPLRHIVETMRPRPLEAIAGMPPSLLGAALIRGVAVPVIDAARLLGAERSPRSQRLVVIKVRERHVALAVDAVEGIETLTSTSLASLPPLLRDASPELVETLGTLDADLIWVLRGAVVVPEAAWAALAGAGPRS